MACIDLYMQLGVRLEHIAVFDSKGHLSKAVKDWANANATSPMRRRRFLRWVRP